MITPEMQQRTPKSKRHQVGAKVTEKTDKHVSATKDITQANISLRGDATLVAHQGYVKVTLEEEEYILYKGDQYCAWYPHQDKEGKKRFINLFNILCDSPDQCHGTIAIIED